MQGHTSPEPLDFAQLFSEVKGQVCRVVLGADEVVHTVLIALFAGGHALLEGPPGLGKTLLARSLARSIGVGFKRIQFTPDLMPSDVTGGNIFNQRADDFVFRPGPVFSPVLLADEINRAPAKTQASLLEAMSDRQVTTDGETRPLPFPFFTLATQNPVESEGTYPLPEAQLDRFLVKCLIGHPEHEVEVQLLRNTMSGFDASDLDQAGLKPILDGEKIAALQQLAREIRVDDEILVYITALVGRTRAHPAVFLGASPRASIGILRCAQVHAASTGRDYVVPDDVKRMSHSVLRHRFLMQPDAELEGVTTDRVVDEILADVPVPGGQES